MLAAMSLPDVVTVTRPQPDSVAASLPLPPAGVYCSGAIQGATQGAAQGVSQQAMLLVDGVVTPVVLVSADGGIVHLNLACRDLLGPQATAYLGQPFASLFVTPEAGQRLAALVGELLSAGPGADRRADALDLDWLLPDGRSQSLSWTATAMPGGDHGPAVLVFNALQAGSVAQLSQRINAIEQRSHVVAAASADCIVLVSASGMIESVNPATERLFGYAAAVLVGQSIAVFLDCRDHAERDAWLDHVLFHPSLGRRGSDNEFTARRQDGHRFPCDLSVAVETMEGRSLYTLVMRNATERRRAEQEMARMRLDLKSIIDSMPSVLVGVDCNCQVTAWNKEAYRITGVPARQAMGRQFRDFFPDLEEYLEEVRAAVHSQSEVETRRISLNQGGQLRHLEVMVYPLKARGSEGAVIRVDDVSTRVRLEQAMVQTEKMVSLGGLAAGMAHEINNPLAAITQSAQNVERRISRDLPRNQMVAESLGVDLAAVCRYLEARGIAGFLDEIRDGAERAAHIVTDMLNFSRSSDGRRVPASLNDMAATALRLAGSDMSLKKRHRFRQIDFVRSFACDLPAVTCDVTGIEQVILNLIKNAAQAMSGAGVAEPLIRLRTGGGEGAVWLVVEDNGPGMDEQVRLRVFEPFFTTKGVGVGTGLGLSVSYFIITEQHHGSLSVSSAPGKGCRFTLRLPVGGRA